MEVNEQLIRAITQAVVEQLHQNGAQPEKKFRHRKHPDPEALPEEHGCVRNILMTMQPGRLREQIPERL